MEGWAPLLGTVQGKPIASAPSISGSQSRIHLPFVPLLPLLPIEISQAVPVCNLRDLGLKPPGPCEMRCGSGLREIPEVNVTQPRTSADSGLCLFTCLQVSVSV